MPCGSKESNNYDKNATNGHCAFEDLDHSVLQQPLNLGVTNIKQILKCIQSGSKEIKDLILNECNIIYECKVCVGLFRSLANFVYHKRCYCKKHRCEDMVLFEHFNEEETIIVQPEPPKAKPEETKKDTSKMADSPADVAQGANPNVSEDIKSTPEAPASAKEKNTASGKAKNKPPEPNPMISRRTRDKNAQNPVSSKAASKTNTSTEPPSKRAKVSPEKTPPEVLDKTLKDSKTVSAEADKISNQESDDVALLESEVANKTLTTDKKSNQPSDPIKEMKTKKIEFTKLSSTLEKNISATFPKIIFKSIDSNPHAVYQSDDKKKLETFGLSHKFEATAVETKLDNDKLIIVLKKDVKSSDGSSGPKPSESSKTKSDTEKSDFHLTRRKRLLARNDCNVYELKCLVCKTQFMSLKTLYFHMLSLHSKKRLYYPCPFCKTLFVQMYGVTRHLVSIHNKTKDQINKLREVIKKKSVWKKIEDVNTTSDANISPINYQLRMSPPPEANVEPPQPEKSESNESEQTLKTVIKLGKNAVLHQCSKCSRVFGRKSSQVSHEKFCIMNAPVKTEERDTSSPPVQASAISSPPPVVSFLSPLPPPSPPKASVPPLKPAANIVQFKQPTESILVKPAAEEKPKPVVKLSMRPKRGAEKRMHKDFVNSQTLKWRSANRVDTHANSKAASSTSAAVSTAPTKKGTAKNLEKKVLSIMNTKNLTCLKCDKKFSSYSNLRRHVAIHVGWTRFKCKFCDYQAYNKSQCWSHVQKAHSVDETDIEKAIVNLVNTNTLTTKKSTSGEMQSSSTKYEADTYNKSSSSKTHTIPKVKISRRKAMTSSKVIIPVKKVQALKKDLPVEMKKERELEKEAVESKKDKPQPAVSLVQKISKKEVVETKKEKLQTTINLAKLPKKEIEPKKEKLQTTFAVGKLPKKEVETKEKKLLTTISIGNLPKKDAETKKEKSQHIIPIQKLTIPDYKRETNYKSVTTSNPTTIILSKKIPSSTVQQSIVTISPDSASSTSKISPIRTSPRKNEGVKGPGERLITTLVTRSSAYSKTTPIQIKLPARSNSTEELSKDLTEKNCSKKERLISEWFPKKDLSSSSVRRESAPLIIGLVPAHAKSTPSVEVEKTSP